MFFKLICVINIIFASAVFSRRVPDITELDEEEQMLFRAAYESPSPSYNQYEYNTPYNQYQYDDEPENKLDLFKDGLWAMKSKMLEMKTIQKALAANMLSSKLKLKELLADKMKLLKPLKKHIHVEVDKKPNYAYQAPTSYSQYQPQKTYTAPAQYTSPVQQYAPPAQHYAPPAQQYTPPAQQHAPATQHYSPPAQYYATPVQQYVPPVQQYASPVQQYAPPVQQYAPPTQEYASSSQHDPYYEN